MKITLYLMTKKGFKTLEHICKNKMASFIEIVVIGQDKKQDDYSDSIANMCAAYGISYTYSKTYEPATEYSILIGWRWLINTSLKLLVFHDSPLPKYRGFAPLVNMLIAGETQIGMSVILANGKYDEGNLVTWQSQVISYPKTILQAIDIISDMYKYEAIRLIADICAGNQIGTFPQGKEASYSMWRDEQDYIIDWSKPSDYIKRFIDATGHPYKSASTTIGGNKKVRVRQAEVVPDVTVVGRQDHLGKVIFIQDECPVVVCGSGLLKLTLVLDEEGEDMLPLKKFRIRFK